MPVSSFLLRFLGLLFISIGVNGMQRDPFQPLSVSGNCPRPEAADGRQWRLQGTLLRQDKQAAWLIDPLSAHHLLVPGQFLPDTSWQVMQISRGKVLLRNTSACLMPEWQLSLSSGAVGAAYEQ